MRTSLALLLLSACLGSVVAAGPAAAQQAWPLPGLTCAISYEAYADPANEWIRGSGSCVLPDGSVVDAVVDGHGFGTPCMPSWIVDLSSGGTLLLDDMRWQRTRLVPPTLDAAMAQPNVSYGPVTSPFSPGQGTAVSIGTYSCRTRPHSGVWNDTGIALLSFTS